MGRMLLQEEVAVVLSPPTPVLLAAQVGRLAEMVGAGEITLAAAAAVAAVAIS